MVYFNLLLLVILDISVLIGKTEINNRIDTYMNILESNPLEIAFDYEITSEYFDKTESWHLIIDSSQKFRIQMGPKTLVSDGIDWRMYDVRTNQILIQDRDTLFEKSIMQWFQKDFTDSLDIIKINAMEYSLFIYDAVKVNIFLNLEEIKVTFIDGEFTHQLNHLTVNGYNGDLDYYYLNISDAFILDMRSKN